MNLKQLKTAADKLRGSSDFRYGDPTTFSITLLEHEVELPGAADPAKYLDLLRRKLKTVVRKGDSVAIVCPGNGGLVAEAARAGAAKVIAIEPRVRYGAAIDRVCALLDSVYEETEIKTHRGWPGARTDIGPFDLVLWPEGLEECRDPEGVLESLAGMIRAEPKGMLCVEVTHGENTRVEPPLNSFRPTTAVWWSVLDGLGGEVLETPGRAAGRTIYRVADDAKARLASETAPEKPKKALAPPSKVEKPKPKEKDSAPKPKPKPTKAEKPKPKEKPTAKPPTQSPAGSGLKRPVADAGK